MNVLISVSSVSFCKMNRSVCFEKIQFHRR